MKDYKYVIVGAGLSGLTIAERIANELDEEVSYPGFWVSFGQTVLSLIGIGKRYCRGTNAFWTLIW